MIFFYHGLIGDHRHFSATRSALAEHVQDSEAPDIPFLENDLPDILQKFGNPASRPAVRVGNSIGCGVAVHAAGPDDQIILTAPPFNYDQGLVPLRKALVRDWVSGLYVQHGAIADEAAFLDHATRQILGLLENRGQIKRLRQYKAAAQSFWTDPKLGKLQNRLTFVIGDQDFTTPASAFCDHVNKHLPRANVEVWSDCGHAVPLDAPRRLASKVCQQQMHLTADAAISS